jgi:predicted nucleic acid-binding protein
VKAVDTPVLLDLLCGSPEARSLVAGWRDQEVATTELNLFELQLLAETGPRKTLAQRMVALERLRRRLTVLPVDSHALGASRVMNEATARHFTPTARLIVSALLANGCSEWHTTRAVAPPGAYGRLKIVEYRSRGAKTLK